MKKKELFAISLLSILLFVSFANVSVAAPPSYVGVKEGDEFIWKASLNVVNLNSTALALFGDENWTYMYNYFLEFYKNSTGMEFDFFKGAGIKAVIQNVTDEIPHPYATGVTGSGIYFDYYIAYAANNWTLKSEAANQTEPRVFMVDPSTTNETTIMYGVFGLPFFMPMGYNYSMFADIYQAILDYSPFTNGNVTFQVHGIGFKMTLKAVFLEWYYNMIGASFEIGTLSDVEMTCRWNSIGVFDYASLVYGDLTLATAYLETTDDGIIPGYELVTFLGVSLATLIALVYAMQKKKILKKNFRIKYLFIFIIIIIIKYQN